MMIFWNLRFFNLFFFVKPMVSIYYWYLLTAWFENNMCADSFNSHVFQCYLLCSFQRFCLPVYLRLHFKFHIWIYDTWWRQSIVVERPCDKMRKLIWIYNDHLLFLFLFQGISEESYCQNTPADEGRRQIQISHNHSTIIKNRHTRTTQVCCQRWKVG